MSSKTNVTIRSIRRQPRQSVCMGFSGYRCERTASPPVSSMYTQRSGGCSAPMTFLFFRLRSEEHTSELQSRLHLVCRLLLEKKKKKTRLNYNYVLAIAQTGC